MLYSHHKIMIYLTQNVPLGLIRELSDIISSSKNGPENYKILHQLLSTIWSEQALYL